MFSIFQLNSPRAMAPTRRPLPLSVWNERRTGLSFSASPMSAFQAGNWRLMLSISSATSSTKTSRISSSMSSEGDGLEAAGRRRAGSGCRFRFDLDLLLDLDPVEVRLVVAGLGEAQAVDVVEIPRRGRVRGRRAGPALAALDPGQEGVKAVLGQFEAGQLDAADRPWPWRRGWKSRR